MEVPPLPKAAFNLSTQREMGNEKSRIVETVRNTEKVSMQSRLLLHCK